MDYQKILQSRKNIVKPIRMVIVILRVEKSKMVTELLQLDIFLL